MSTYSQLAAGASRMQYLSHSSFSLYEKDKDAFYVKYMAEQRPPSFKQTQPMSVGSAFDAYVKFWLAKRTCGGFNFVELFESQVESHNRDWARAAGADCFAAYQRVPRIKDCFFCYGAFRLC